jgi:PhoPQ-activated pathogenicity-related protein
MNHRRLPSVFLGLVQAITLSSVAASRAETPLDRYVNTPDAAYRWSLVQSTERQSLHTAILEMTSQTWLTTNEVNRPTWNHWLVVVRPDKVQHETALLFIGGGSNDRPAPTQADRHLAQIAQATRSVVAELRMIPNQPLVFGNDGQNRVEDDLIAYTWDRFLRTGDERWPARLPMTKAAVRAMDTLTAFCATPAGGQLKVDRFFVSGGSKRGWTTWTTAAVDKRVVGIAPVVIDLLNVEPSFIHHFEVYGFYAPAVADYERFGIMDWQGTPEYRRLMEIVEPYEYRSRFTLPKFIINATGDQFFVPDSSQFYFDDLPGPKFLRYVPNADHSLRDTDAFETLASCYYALLNQSELPRFSWSFPDASTIRVHCQTPPRTARLWQATNPASRDFRLETIGAVWNSTLLEPAPDGAFLTQLTTPPKGWSAFLVELTFDHPGAPAPFKFTTPVRILPDTKPHRYVPPDRHPVASAPHTSP